MDKNQAIEFFSSLAVFGIRPGLERTAKALDMLGLPRAGRFIHIAGTNGKGSAAAFASSILTEAGLLTGTYTSPYVFSINERFGIGRGYISDADLGSIAEEVKKTNGLLKAESGESLTEFEAKTVAAFIYFARKKTDWNVIECGMGGGSDATNVITPRCSVIVSVGLDHTEWLGSTVREIAREKAGIIKPGVPCVTGAGGEALEEIDRKAEKAGSRVYALGRDFFVRGSGPFRLESDIIETEFEPSLQGAFQPGNAAIAAVAAALCERLSPKDIQNGIKKAFLPGRFQRISRRPDVYLDGAHNGPAAEALARSLEALGNKKLILVIGML
ncbi:MAG: bifunctional folylpolyglutamate synthase/dihydrofolate synthase, partial [Abditibacteriota bacterium]|nr:bifunctional folylpolyglutamate synthase/dihydrofolate synthase [Abditibacteriota bacterium]